MKPSSSLVVRVAKDHDEYRREHHDYESGYHFLYSRYSVWKLPALFVCAK